MALLQLFPAFGAGVLIAGAFFGGLWLTLKHLSHARRPTLILVVSLLVRLLLAGGGFYLVAALGGWQQVIAALAGFLLLRLVLVRHLAPVAADPAALRDRSGASGR